MTPFGLKLPWDFRRAPWSGERRNLQSCSAQGSQHLQCESQAKPSAVDAVYQDPVVHDHPAGLQPSGEFLVGHAFGLAQVFDERFSPGLVEVTGLQF